MKPDANGQVHITLPVRNPTITKLLMSEAVIWLLVEPDDAISIQKLPRMGSEPLGGVFIDGEQFDGAHLLQ